MNRLERTSVPVVALSHPGIKRKGNEDRYGVSAFTQGPDGPKPILLAVLADGIGGHRAGEVAAEIAVNAISHWIAAGDTRNPPEQLVEAIQRASDAIRDQATLVPEQAGMGATCACAWVIGNRLYTATVGDSRIYLMRDGGIRQLSTDHTWVQEAIERGLLQPDQANGHPNAHVIRRYLGSPASPEVDLRLRTADGENDAQAEANQGFLLLPGDRLLLTSDGLTDLVSDAEILAAFQQKDGETASGSLLELALERGGHDNVTMVTFEIPTELQAAPPRPRAPSPLRWVGAGCLGVLGVAALIVTLVGGWWLFKDRLTLPNPFGAPSATATLPATLPAETQPAAEAPPAVPPVVEATQTPTAQRPTLPPLDAGGATLTPWPTNTRTASD